MEEQLINIAVGNDMKYKTAKKTALVSFLNLPVGSVVKKLIMKKLINEIIYKEL